MQFWLSIYRYRELAEVLVARELKARYRGTVLGFFWSFASPLIMMSIYVLVFSYYLHIDIPNYPVFLLSGLLPWTCFTASVSDGMHSMIHNGSIIKKVYLPTEVFPFVSVAANVVHYLLSAPVLLLFMFMYGIVPSVFLLLFPLLLLLQFFFTYALALCVASLGVQFRDLIYIVPNLLMTWMYLTPIFYERRIVPERYRFLIDLNPMSCLIESYQDIFYHQHMPNLSKLAVFAGVSCMMVFFALRLFKKRRDLYPELV